jgi:hypothetical protein
LRERNEELQRRNLKVAVVTFENDYFARSYVAETALDWPLLIDEQRLLYRGYDMLDASFWDLWGPKTWWAYGTLLLKGEKLQAAGSDVSQRGGDVLIDPDGIVRLHHVGDGPADRPAVEEILARVTTRSRKK